MKLVTMEAVREAYPHVRAAVRRTPLFTSASVAARAGCPALYLKMENLQRTGSFKIRGATHRVRMLSDAERARGVITASAGNHAQGLALAARDAQVAATVFMPQTASIAKIQATEGYGARVALEGANFDDAVAAAQARAQETGAVFVSYRRRHHHRPGDFGYQLLEDLQRGHV